MRFHLIIVILILFNSFWKQFLTFLLISFTNNITFITLSSLNRHTHTRINTSILLMKVIDNDVSNSQEVNLSPCLNVVSHDYPINVEISQKIIFEKMFVTITIQLFILTLIYNLSIITLHTTKKGNKINYFLYRQKYLWY